MGRMRSQSKGSLSFNTASLNVCIKIVNTSGFDMMASIFCVLISFSKKYILLPHHDILFLFCAKLHVFDGANSWS